MSKAKLKDKIESTFDEALILIMAAEVVLGFQFKSVFETGFANLPAASQLLKVSGLGLLLICVCVLMAPAAYHYLVEQGEETEHFYSVSSRFVVAAMVSLALGMAGDFYVVVSKVGSHPPPASPPRSPACDI